MGVAREPENVPGHGEEEEQREEVRFACAGGTIELKHVEEEQDERDQAEMVSGYRLSEPPPDAGPVPPPGRQLLRPSVGTLDLDLQVREDERHEEEVRAEREGHEARSGCLAAEVVGDCGSGRPGQQDPIAPTGEAVGASWR